MSERQPRLFVEAFEREVSAAGLFSVRRSVGPRHLPGFDAVLVAPDADTPAHVVPVDGRGTVSVADALFIYR